MKTIIRVALAATALALASLAQAGYVDSGQVSCSISPGLISNNTLVGNTSGSSAFPSAYTPSAFFDAIFGSAQGSLLYRNASTWVTLSPGTSGQFLQTGGAAANLSWASGYTNPMTTGGDLIYGGTSGTATRLPNGTSGQVLVSSGGTAAPAWTTLGAGSGSVTSVSVTTTNGISGTVATATSTPAISLALAAASPYSLLIGPGDGTATMNNFTTRGPAASGTGVTGSNWTFDASNGTGTGGSGAFVFRTAPAQVSGMSVSNSVTVSSTNVASQTQSYTVATGSNQVLIVAIGQLGLPGAPTAVTFNGTAMTQLTSLNSSNNRLDIYYLLNPAVTTANVAITYAGNEYATVQIFTMSGVNQTTPFGTPASLANVSSSTISVAPTTVSGQTVIDFVSAYGFGAATPTAGQTQISALSTNQIYSTASYKTASGTSTTMSYSWGTAPNSAGIIAVGVNPASNTTADTLTEALRITNAQQIGIQNSAPAEALDVAGNVRLKHLRGSSSTPTQAAGTGAGTSPTVSLTGTDLAGQVNVTTGTSPTASGPVTVVSFATTYTAAPYCLIVPANAATATLTSTANKNPYVSASTTSGFTITAGSAALTASTAYSWWFHCIQ